jgi:hypothetical protein
MLARRTAKLLTCGLPEARREALVGRPFQIRSKGQTFTAQAFGYKDPQPQIEIDSSIYTGMTWLEVAAAVERGCVPDISRLNRVRGNRV